VLKDCFISPAKYEQRLPGGSSAGTSSLIKRSTWCCITSGSIDISVSISGTVIPSHSSLCVASCPDGVGEKFVLSMKMSLALIGGSVGGGGGISGWPTSKRRWRAFETGTGFNFFNSAKEIEESFNFDKENRSFRICLKTQSQETFSYKSGNHWNS